MESAFGVTEDEYEIVGHDAGRVRYVEAGAEGSSEFKSIEFGFWEI